MKREATIRIWIAAVSMALLVLAWAACADSVRLTWDPSPSDGIAGYRIYYGTNSGSYQFVTNAGLSLTQTVVLPYRTRWFFAATAYDTNLVESDYSNEVEWEDKPLPPVLQGVPLVRVAPIIEHGTNMVDWSEVLGSPTFFPATNAVEFFRASRLTIERVTQLNP